MKSELKDFLDGKVLEYNRPEFIEEDPISIPHRFSNKQDIEIAALFAATFAWGQRKTIIAKCSELLRLMDDDPHNFVLNHTDADLKHLQNFKHRTFNGTDTLYFVHFLNRFYRSNDSLELAFVGPGEQTSSQVEDCLRRFHYTFFDDADSPRRTRKHVSTPERNSACKRLNMFLRWMVRSDEAGVDFGIWKRLDPGQLICPCDVHVGRVARSLGLLSRKQTDWNAAMELTSHLRGFDPSDPVKYDFALFGLGVIEGFAGPNSALKAVE